MPALSARSPGSSFSKLPPIATGEADRNFLRSVGNFIDKEIIKINTDDDEQRYLVYKSAFNQVIDYSVAYRPLLTAIKQEYENSIEAIQKSQRDAVFLQGQLKAMASEPTTLRNYKRRTEQLAENLSIVKDNSRHLAGEVCQLIEFCKRKDQEEETAEMPKEDQCRDSRRIPGLTLEESTDLCSLNRGLDKLDRQLKELNISFKTRYVSKVHKHELKDTLVRKVEDRDKLLIQSQFFKAKCQRLKVALEAANAYNRVKPPHQTVGDAVTLSLQQYMRSQGLDRVSLSAGEEGREGLPGSSTFDDDDPSEEQEAEVMLEYIEKFNELFEDGKYEEAAIHAANSPKGILRTQATLAKFRDVKGQIAGRSPLLAFCDTVMSSVKVASRPDKLLSMDCVRCGLSENRIDLLYHWIAQDWLTLSAGLGDMLRDHCHCILPCKCGVQALAQTIYDRVQFYEEAVVATLCQGRVKVGLEYARRHQLLNSDFLNSIVATCPSLPLLLELCSPSQPLLPLGDVLSTLLFADHIALAVQFLLLLQRQTVEDQIIDTNLLRLTLLLDHTTSLSSWNLVISRLELEDYSEMALQLAAAVIVATALRSALEIVTSASPASPLPTIDAQVGVSVKQPCLDINNLTANTLKAGINVSQLLLTPDHTYPYAGTESDLTARKIKHKRWKKLAFGEYQKDAHSQEKASQQKRRIKNMFSAASGYFKVPESTTKDDFKMPQSNLSSQSSRTPESGKSKGHRKSMSSGDDKRAKNAHELFWEPLESVPNNIFRNRSKSVEKRHDGVFTFNHQRSSASLHGIFPLPTKQDLQPTDPSKPCSSSLIKPVVGKFDSDVSDGKSESGIQNGVDTAKASVAGSRPSGPKQFDLPNSQGMAKREDKRPPRE